MPTTSTPRPEPVSLTAEVLVAAGDTLGEGPHWDAARVDLLRVDIIAGAVHRYHIATGHTETTRFGDLTSFAIPRSPGGLVVGVRHQLITVDADGTRHVLATVEEDRGDNRFNDAKCDAAGRLWAGTMSMRREPGTAALYRVSSDRRVDMVLDGLTIANGLGWSGDGTRMYVIDSPTQRIDVYDYDLETGTLTNPRLFVHIDPADGLPDGLAVDGDDGVWVALFGGGQVRRYTPDGALNAILRLPVTNCTCPTFGGAELDQLYVTSAQHRLSPDELAAQPLAGAVFAARPGVCGRPATAFAG